MKEIRYVFYRGYPVDYLERDVSTRNLVLMDRQRYDGVDLDDWR